jgi:hypothetical protein
VVLLKGNNSFTRTRLTPGIIRVPAQAEIPFHDPDLLFLSSPLNRRR